MLYGRHVLLNFLEACPELANLQSPNLLAWPAVPGCTVQTPPQSRQDNLGLIRLRMAPKIRSADVSVVESWPVYILVN